MLETNALQKEKTKIIVTSLNLPLSTVYKNFIQRIHYFKFKKPLKMLIVTVYTLFFKYLFIHFFLFGSQ